MCGVKWVQVSRVIVLTFKNLLSKGTFGAQLVDLGLPQVVQSLKAQAWSDEVRELVYHSHSLFYEEIENL